MDETPTMGPVCDCPADHRRWPRRVRGCRSRHCCSRRSCLPARSSWCSLWAACTAATALMMGRTRTPTTTAFTRPPAGDKDGRATFAARPGTFASETSDGGEPTVGWKRIVEGRESACRHMRGLARLALDRRHLSMSTGGESTFLLRPCGRVVVRVGALLSTRCWLSCGSGSA